jgi:hypothetical protein
VQRPSPARPLAPFLIAGAVWCSAASGAAQTPAVAPAGGAVPAALPANATPAAAGLPGTPATPAPAPAGSPPASPSPVEASPAPLPPAGVVPADATVELAGVVSPAFALNQIRRAIDVQTGRRAGTAIDVHGIDIPASLQPGDTLEAQAGVHLDGRGTAQNVDGRTNVHLRVRALPNLDPQLLWYSDDPEYLAAGSDGVLFGGAIDPDAPVRIFAYHVAVGAPRRVALVLRGATVPQRVQILGTIAGPSPGFAYIGQQSSARFLLARTTQESTIVTVQPGVPFEIPLARLQPGDLAEAILDLRVLDGGPLDAAVVTVSGDAPAASLLGTPEVPDDAHGRRGTFALTGVPPIELAYTAGAADPAPFVAGMPGLANLRPGGRPLAGDYGLVRPVSLTLSNPGPDPQTVYLYAVPTGGSATVTMFFTGDAAATMIPCIADAATRYAIKAFALAPGEQRTVTGSFMTDGASTYPLDLGLTATPPAVAQPGECSAGASPAPVATPTA